MITSESSPRWPEPRIRKTCILVDVCVCGERSKIVGSDEEVELVAVLKGRVRSMRIKMVSWVGTEVAELGLAVYESGHRNLGFLGGSSCDVAKKDL